ncbi:MAG: asparagine synthetase B, partial [Rhodoplanes sp.]
MCGIVGTVIFRGDSKIDPDLLQRMRDTMQHRGPDGGAQWIDPRGRVGLGHRRLSIIDLSNAATQPMATPDGRFVVTFNGEIYNHAEI